MLLLKPPATLFPYTTLFRSALAAPAVGIDGHVADLARHVRDPTVDRSPEHDAAPDPRADREPDHDRHGDRGRHRARSEEHTSELQSRQYLVCRPLLERKKKV